jgi:hypothetical protein
MDGQNPVSQNHSPNRPKQEHAKTARAKDLLVKRKAS